jgi:hypothetical protein
MLLRGRARGVIALIALIFGDTILRDEAGPAR